MSFLDKVIRGINRAAEPVQRVTTPVDRRLTRAADLAERGQRRSGRIVGIHRRLSDGHTRTVFAIDVAPDAATGAPAQRVATEVTPTPHLHRLRLGLEVPVRVSGGRGVLDWRALASRWGLGGAEPGQRVHTKPPADGILEQALDERDRKRLERGHRTTATITGMRWVQVMGMRTENWDVHLRLADGSMAVSTSNEVPHYARWSAVVGATVPIALDTKDPSKASVDWTAVALAAPPARLDDPPPPGSISAEVEAAFDVPATPAAGAGRAADPREVIAAHRNAGHVHGALRSWVDEVHAGRMKPKTFLDSVAEWESAGLCTPDEAAAARSAAGLG